MLKYIKHFRHFAVKNEITKRLSQKHIARNKKVDKNKDKTSNNAAKEIESLNVNEQISIDDRETAHGSGEQLMEEPEQQQDNQAISIE